VPRLHGLCHRIATKCRIPQTTREARPCGDLGLYPSFLALASPLADSNRVQRTLRRRLSLLFANATLQHRHVVASGAPATRHARVDSLRRSSTDVVEAVVSDEDGHFSHLVIDRLRAAARSIGLRDVAAPGYRIVEREGRETIIFHYWEEAHFLSELHDAGKICVARRGFVFTVREPSTLRPEEKPRHVAAPSPAMILREAQKAWGALGQADRLLRQVDVQKRFDTARAMGRTKERRSVAGRVPLRRAISWIDFIRRDGQPGCYRRVLMELALDAGLAELDACLGLDVGKTGHAWLADDARAAAYDVAFQFSASKA
jgi:hypothetical protein